MASICERARRTLQASATRNAVSKLCSTTTTTKSSQSLSGGAASKLPGFAASPRPNSASPFSFNRLFTSSRLPVELGGAQSLMPLHSATASALYTSMLSLSQSWGCLSEGFATPL